MHLEKKKLVFYGIKYFPSRGGTSRVAEAIAKQLSFSHNITMYCYKNAAARYHISNVKTVQFPQLATGSMGVFIYYFISALHLVLTQHKESIIHAHKTDCSLFLPLLRLKFKYIVATSHEAPYQRDKWGFTGKKYFKLMEWMFMHSRVTLTSISKPLADYYENKYQKKVLFIPNGIDLQQNIDMKSAKKLIIENNIQSPYLIFSARRIMSTKGLHTLLEALDLLDSKIPLIIAGDPNHARKYVNTLKKKYSHFSLIFTGYLQLPVLLGLIKQSKLFIFPSEVEGMSIMLLEVVSLGVHMICSDIPENTQIFNNEEMLFFRSKDAKSLSQKIHYALNNKKEMDHKADLSKRKIASKFSWKSICKQYAALYANKPMITIS